ncbi:MAG: AraC family transcriptional regulator ligand-binding domain-containing protein [Myxococcota bacterium]|nr:AraC family transcriptional regulator ligand-binding domain-containing protein [Myxococcota bacterium]
MRRDITASGAWSQMIVRGLEGLGLDVHGMCQALDVSYASLVDPDARNPVDVLTRLWAVAEQQSGDRHVGLRVARQLEPRLNHLHAHMLLAGRNLRQGILAIRPTIPILMQGASIELEDQGEVFSYRFVESRGDLAPSRHATEFSARVIQRVHGLVHGGLLPLRRIGFEHRHPGSSREHEAVFGCPVRFGQAANELLIDREVMLKPSPHHSAELLRQLQALAEQELQRLRTPGFAAEVRSRLRSRLCSGAFQADAIAAELHLGCRTFQRRLEAEQTSFSELLDEVRRELALDLIRSDLPLKELAARCGFSGPGTLIRAFRRWTGTTPAAYRTARSPSAQTQPASRHG